MSAFSIQELLQKDQYDDLNSIIQGSTLEKEPENIQLLSELLNKLTDNKTAFQAKETGNLIISKMNAFAMKIYMDVLYENMGSMKWQIKKGS